MRRSRTWQARAESFGCAIGRDEFAYASTMSGPTDPTPDAVRDGPEALYMQAQALLESQAMAQAFPVFEQAADMGHVRARIEAARMLLHGVGVEADPARAIAWLEQAERAGNAIAGFLLAVIAAGNVLLPRDIRIDQRMLAAMQAGHPPALLAAALHFGRKPDPRDQTRCIQLLGRGMKLGDPLAAQLLAPRLRHGEGCVADPAAADAIEAELATLGIAPLPKATCGTPVQIPSPPGQLALADAWHRPAVRALSQRPGLVVVDGLLSADECRLLMATARPELQRSEIIDPTETGRIESDLRTSSDAGFAPVQEDLALRLVQARMASVVGAEFTCAEQLIVLRYEPGQQFHPHRDFIAPGALADRQPQSGNRAATVCVYLNDVEAGGATRFPVPGVSIQPRAGCAIAFRNLTPDGGPDPDSVHAGLPVERGEKWLATLWIRLRRYRAF
jgi:hypothetical protein